MITILCANILIRHARQPPPLSSEGPDGILTPMGGRTLFQYRSAQHAPMPAWGREPVRINFRALPQHLTEPDRLADPLRPTAVSPSSLALAIAWHLLVLVSVVWLSGSVTETILVPPEPPFSMIFEQAPVVPAAAAPNEPQTSAAPIVPVPAAPSLREHTDLPPPAEPAPPQAEAPVPAEPQTLPQPPAAQVPDQPVAQIMPDLPLPPVPPARPPRPRSAVTPQPSRETLPSGPAPAAVAPAASVAIARGTPVLIPPRPVAGMASDRAPVYPETARRRNEQGRVVLRVNVGPAGTALAVAVGRSSGFPVLDNAAVDAVRNWRFIPATEGGRPVPATAEVPVVFRLED